MVINEFPAIEEPSITVDKVEYGSDWIKGYKNNECVITHLCVADFSAIHLYDEKGNEVRPSLDQVKETKLREINTACQDAIYEGVAVETSQGYEYFSLTEEDQINIQNLLLQIQSGATNVLYHADRKLCRPFNSEEILALAAAATTLKTYQLTYCNHIRYLINQLDTIEKINTVQYGMQLPSELQNSLNQLLGG